MKSLWCCLLLTLPAFPCLAQDKALVDRLNDALRAGDAAAVAQTVAQAKSALGEKAGEPETPDVFEPIPAGVDWLTQEEVRKAVLAIPKQVAPNEWWRIGIDPATMNRPLREPAEVVSGCVHAARTGFPGSDEALQVARRAAEFLMWAQQQAGSGLFPFPAVRHNGLQWGRAPARPVPARDGAFKSAERALARAEREGRLDQMIRNRWIVDDPGEGGLQFDNAMAGVAMFELYETTRENDYLESAARSADWAASRPLVTNWNYNSFSVWLLAKAYEVTREQRYLDAAVQKAVVGVLPGQLKDGPRAGRWLDPHNAKPSYHYIILRALAALTAAAPADHPARPDLIHALKIGLRARNSDFLDKGAPNKSTAMEVLVAVNPALKDEAFLKESLSREALNALGKLVSDQARQRKMPLSPRAWGLFLEYAADR